MKARVSALLAGVLFGAGLIVAGMTDASKVRAFLDVFGAWDPSLAFVMVGAIGVHFLLRRLVLRLRGPLFGGTFEQVEKTGIDRRLVLGAAVFGVGWGLGGICPGPGIVNAGSGSLAGLVFASAMVAGIAVERRLRSKRSSAA